MEAPLPRLPRRAWPITVFSKGSARARGRHGRALIVYNVSRVASAPPLDHGPSEACRGAWPRLRCRAGPPPYGTVLYAWACLQAPAGGPPRRHRHRSSAARRRGAPGEHQRPRAQASRRCVHSRTMGRGAWAPAARHSRGLGTRHEHAIVVLPDAISIVGWDFLNPSTFRPPSHVISAGGRHRRIPWASPGGGCAGQALRRRRGWLRRLRRQRLLRQPQR